MALGVLLTVYVAVAALNYSVVQSYLGTAASRYFSREWGCELHIGSLHAMPWDHLILDDVLLVAPRGDTIFRGEALRVRFRRFPFSNGELSSRLDLDRVYLKNAYYHFEKYTDEEYGGEGGINIQFIIDYYSSRSNDEDDDTPGKPFAVNVRSLTLDNVHYKMDLPDYGEVWESPGVDIMHMEYLDIHGRFRNVHVVGPDVTVKIVKLSTTERSGFRVENVTGDVHVSPQDITVRGLDVETAHSHIMADTRMTYPDWMGDYVHVVQHEALVKEGATVNLGDVAYWAPVLWGNDVQLRCDGSFGGKIDSIVVDRIWVGYGGATTAEVTARIMGLPDIEQTVFEVERLDVRGEESDMRRLEEESTELIDGLDARVIGRDLRAVGMELDAVDIRQVLFDKAAEPVIRERSADLQPQQGAEPVGSAPDSAHGLAADAHLTAPQRPRQALIPRVIFRALDAADEREVHAVPLHRPQHLAHAEVEGDQVADMGV